MAMRVGDVVDNTRAALESFERSELAKFRSWRTPEGNSPQGKLLRIADQPIRIFRSGNRVGKTTVGAVDVLLDCLGWHPWSPRVPPVNWWVSGLSWDVVGEIIWPKMRPLLPMEQVEDIVFLRKSEAAQVPMAVKFKNGSMIRFKSADAGRLKYQGASLDGVWIDEEHPADVVEEARARLVDRRGTLLVTLTPLMRKRWVQDLERNPRSTVIRTSMREAAKAGILDPDEVEAFAAELPERQRRVRVDGDFAALEGQVYPDLHRETHGCVVRNGQLVTNSGIIVASWPLPDVWPRWAAVDWGFANPTAVIVAAEDLENGRIIVEKCYYAAGLYSSVWARLLVEGRLPKKLRVPLISDHDSRARCEANDVGLNTVAAYKNGAEFGIHKGIESVARLLVKKCRDDAPGLLFALTGENDSRLGRCDAEKVLWEAELYHYATTRADRPDPKDLPVKKDDHAMDALRYLVVAWERAQTYGDVPDPNRFLTGREGSRALDALNKIWKGR